MISNSKILFIGAHPDDIELGCGATISKLKRDGNHITWLVLSNCNESLPKDQQGRLIQELQFSANHYLVNCVKKEFPVRRFPEYRNEIREYLYWINKSLEPDYVFTHNVNDSHQDHQVVAEDSIRIFNRYTDIFMYGMPYNLSVIKNNMYCSVAQIDIENKIKALSYYKSQMELNRTYFNNNYIKSMCMNNGVNSGVEFAEGFELHKITI